MYTQPKLLMYQLILYNILKIFWLTINSKFSNTYIVPVVVYDIIYRKNIKYYLKIIMKIEMVIMKYQWNICMFFTKWWNEAKLGYLTVVICIMKL